MKKIIIIISIMIMIVMPLSAVNVNETEQSTMAPSIAVIPPPLEMENEVDPDKYIIGVGDQFLIELLVEQTTMIVPVLPTGDIVVNGKTSYNVKGKTLAEVYTMVNESEGPYVKFYLYEVKKIKVPVIGAVKNPGTLTFSATSRISDVLKKTPLRYLGKDFEIMLISDNDTNVINIYDYYLNGNEEQNPYIRAGQTIYIPFADPETECVEVYGPVMVRSFVPFIKGETLGEFYRRKIVLSDVMNYEEIVVIRNGEQIVLTASEMNSFVLKAKDRIEFMTLKKIMVSGHVNRPGTYEYVAGHTLTDYVAMAGGANYKGSDQSAIVIRDNKKFKNPQGMEIKRGDIILVKRSAEDVLIGEISILSFISLLASIASTVITAFIAAGSL